MIPENLKFGGEGGTPPTTAAICLVLIFGLLVLLTRRKHASFCFLLAAFVIPFRQSIVIAGAHFQMIRFLAIFGLLRILWDGVVKKREAITSGFHPVDRAFVYFTIVSAVTFILLNQQWAAVTNQVGGFLNSIAVYFVLRFLIRDEDDAVQALKAMTVVAILAAISMLTEQLTARNWFSYLGGVPLVPDIREGHVRSQAFFAHSIIAGCVGAVLIPLSYWLWLKGGKLKRYAILCFVSAMTMVITSRSSTPIMAAMAAMLAFAFWPLRRDMKWVRRGTVAALVVLHLVMHGPVWALIDHVDIVGGNSANHRYQLVDQCIRHFWDWWLIGTNANASWGFDMWDTANYFVGTAEGGGLLALVLLILILSRAFRSVGLARVAFEDDKHKQLLFWCLGAALFAQADAFFGISYYDQSIVSWYLLLVIVIACTGEYGIAAIRQPARIAQGSVSTLRTSNYLDDSKPIARPYGFAPNDRKGIGIPHFKPIRKRV